MRKKILKTLVCVTAVLVFMWLTMQPVSSGDTEISEITKDKAENVEEHIVFIEPKADATEEQEEVVVMQSPVEEIAVPEQEQEVIDMQQDENTETSTCTYETLYSASEFMTLGVIHWNEWRWTWYSERVLPGGGLSIPGRHNDENGYVCDENDYICLSSSTLSNGTVIDTPFGKQGKVYDTGCPSDVIDVYVGW